MGVNELQIQVNCPIKAQNAGLFISRGGAMHPTRVIQSHELIFVIQGELDMWEEEQIFHLSPSQTLHLYPGRRHGSTKPMPSDLKFYWVHFEIEAEASEPAAKNEPHSALVTMPQVTRLSHPDSLERLFRVFLNEQETATLRPLTANLLMMLMLIEVAHQSQSEANTNGVNVVATWAHHYIRMNYDKAITAGKVAAAVGYNADYLERIYRQTYDCTLTQAIHRRRIQKACDYLLNSNLTVIQIAARCGFTDPDYFRRIFKRYMQISPTDYRHENSRLHVITH